MLLKAWEMSTIVSKYNYCSDLEPFLTNVLRAE